MSRSVASVLVACAFVGASALGCSLIVQTSGLVGTPDGGADKSDGATSDGSGSLAPDTGTDAAASCAGHAGMIDAGRFCIDALEVTNADYTTFVTTKGNDFSGQSALCGWNKSYALACASLTTDPAAPVTCIDWCDAHAYCESVGKRLCGKIGGGAVTTKSDFTDGTVDQWYRACSHAGDHDFPYGDAFQPGACNDTARGLGKPIAVGTSPKCEGGYPGIFDMSGNATEWEDACAGTAGATDKCSIRGGAWDDSATANTNFLACNSANSTVARNYADNTIGFRCCVD